VLRAGQRAFTEVRHLSREAVEKYHALEGGQQTLRNLAAYVTELTRNETTWNETTSIETTPKERRTDGREGVLQRVDVA
jgi:hypothetical protein